MGRFITAMNQSAQDWSIPKRVAWWIFWVPIIGAVLLAFARVNRQFFTLLTMEDGPLEWPQFLFFAAALLAGFGVAVRRFRAGHPWQGLLFLGFGSGACFIAGEGLLGASGSLDSRRPKI